MSTKTCKSCVIKMGNVCQLTNQQINPDDFCSKWRNEIFTCCICGAGILDPVIDEEQRIFCGQCAGSVCRSCSGSRKCEFNENPDPTPRVIMQTQQQGNMVMQTQVRNPERERKFCYICGCWNGEHCQREFGSCKNWKFILNG